MTLVIMLVDDEQFVRELLALALEEKGYRVLQAVNGRHALSLISDLTGVRPDLIISDVMMPILDGVGLCRAIKSSADTAGIPVILMTAASPSPTVDARADAFVAKPFDLDAIDPLIESILARDSGFGKGMMMNLSTRVAREGAQGADARGLATVQFRHDQKNSGVSRHGPLRPGGRLRIEYDPARLVPAFGLAKPITDVVCHLGFQPSGEQQSATLAAKTEPVHYQAGPPRPLACEVQIPSETTQVEVWFEGRASAETTGWDSRYGQNFTFPVTGEGLPVPKQSVTLRPNARVDASRINVVEDAAFKEHVGLGSSGTRLQTGLRVRADISEPSAAVVVYADVHVFDAMGDLLHAASIGLEPNASSGPDAALRLWDADVYPGSGGASGVGVWSRPDAHTINYRLYCQVDDTLFTDGVLHQFEVPADTEVRPIPGGW